MAKLIKKLLLSASVAAGVSTVGAVPAIAADFTVTGGGTYDYISEEYLAPDVIFYDTWTHPSTGQTYTYKNQSADINSILDGDSSNPGGNIELFASSESIELVASSESEEDFGTNLVSTLLTGEINGQQLTLSSLNVYDWFWNGKEYDYSYGGNTLATEWVTKFVDNVLSLMSDNIFVQLLIQDPASYEDIMATAHSMFLDMGVFQRASDPNISYINIGSDGNDINIGLAGHYDLSSFYSSFIANILEIEESQVGSILPSGIQASEVVKYTYNGVTDYLYSFEATQSGLIEWSDQASHTGNYEVTISVPEPSTMIGLMTVGGLLAAAKKKGQSKKEA